MRYVPLALMSFAFAVPGSIAAQSPNAASWPPATGDHVRLSAIGDSAFVVGRVTRVDADQMAISPDDSGAVARTILLSTISHLEIQRDVRTREIATTVGVLIGVAAGASYYYLGLCRQDEAGCAQEQRRAAQAQLYDQTYVTTGDVLAIAGMLAGGLLGYLLAPAPHWSVVAVPTVDQGPAGDAHAGVRIGLSWNFRDR